MGSYTLIPGPLNNRHEPLRLGVVDNRERIVSTLVEADNVDVGAAGTITRRAGRTLKLSGTPHSMWVHPQADTTCYFISDGVLKQLNTDYTATDLSTLSTDSPAAFQELNTEVIMANGADIGWVSGAGFEAFAPTLGDFEATMPAGQYLAFFNGSLVVASASRLYVSLPWDAERRDTRLSTFPLNGYIRMLGAVEDGLYVATEHGVGFVAGDGPDDFSYRLLTPHAPADGCFNAGFEGVGDAARQVVCWASSEGFCKGVAGGQYQNRSKDQIVLPRGSSGRYFKIDEKGRNRHIAVIHDPDLVGAYEAPTITKSTTTIL